MQMDFLCCEIRTPQLENLYSLNEVHVSVRFMLKLAKGEEEELRTIWIALHSSTNMNRWNVVSIRDATYQMVMFE